MDWLIGNMEPLDDPGDDLTERPSTMRDIQILEDSELNDEELTEYRRW
jgi:hypothetical protein